ncbi:MAG: glycoside hydrolase family 99-like domain-containing protein [Pirellulaceae bacterium]
MQAIHYLDASETTPRVITIYAWNEWTEGGYLEPEQRTGMSYLEALQRVLSPAAFPPPDVRGSE